MTETVQRGKYDDADVPEGISVLHVTDETGDTRLMWDPRDKDDVKAAKAAFDEAKGRGMVAYTVKKNGEQGEVIREFDKTEGKIIMVRQTQGG